MKFDTSLAIRRAFDYSMDLNRLLLLTGFFVLGAIFVLALVLPVYVDLVMGTVTFASIAGAVVWMVLGVAAAYLIFTYVTILFTENYVSRKTLSESAAAVKPVYLVFLVATFLSGVISAIVGMVPVLGFIFSIIAALVFFFVPQEVVLGKSGIDSLSKSYNIFMKNKLDVFVALVVGTLVSLLIFFVFLIPLMLAGAMTLLTLASSGSLTAALMANLPAFIVTGLIAVVGLALTTLFGNSFRTEAYLQIVKGTKKEKTGKSPPRKASTRKK